MAISMNKALISGAIVIIVLMVGGAILLHQEAEERATVSTNDVTLSVRVADNPWERTRGLSGLTAEQVKAQGMLFVFPEAEVQRFWMKGMELPLDVLWIRDGKIISLDENVPAPKAGEEPASMTSEPIPVDMVLELPAGYAKHFDLRPGSPLKIELP
ncbi:MAG TPA: DUF192 domain-containing protein [bacterium]|nr:DUF192 domain-containing protein [bacterium]